MAIDHSGVTRMFPDHRVALSDTGLLMRHGGSVQLTKAHATLVELLLDRHSAPVTNHELSRVLWSSRSPSDFARTQRIMHIRRQLAAVGLALRLRPGVGYTLEEGVGSDRARILRSSPHHRVSP